MSLNPTLSPINNKNATVSVTSTLLRPKLRSLQSPLLSPRTEQKLSTDRSVSSIRNPFGNLKSLQADSFPAEIVLLTGVAQPESKPEARNVSSLKIFQQFNAKKLPKILNKLNNAAVNETESTSFNVKINGKDRPPYKWYQDEMELKLTDDYELIEKEDEITLVIKSCKANNTGTYYLKFKNSFGEVASNKAKLIVNRAPKLLKSPKNTYITSDQPVKLECIVDAMPKAKCAWFLKDRELLIKDNVKFETDLKSGLYSLVIAKVNPLAHFGIYTFKASNSVGSIEHSFELNLKEIPKIVNKLDDLTVTEGELVKFAIETTGKPRPIIEWFYNEEEIDISLNDLYEITEVENLSTFIIKAVLITNYGSYHAKATNDAGSINSNKAQLNVKPVLFRKAKISTIPATFIKPLIDISYGNLSKIKEFPVQISAKPIARIKVFKDNRELKSSSHLKFESEKLNENLIGFKLIIDNTQASDSGIYKIEAINKLATVCTQTHFIVKGEPVFVRKPSDLNVIEKKQTNIYCEVLGFPMPTVEWFKDDILIDKTDNIQIEVKGKGLNSLLIKSVTMENVGAYKVKAKNESGQIECSFNLMVDVAPFIISSLKDKFEVLAGEPVRLECSIGGSPIPNITWEKRGAEIKASKENGIELFKNGNTHTLILKSTLIEDASIFIILATNRLGKTQSKSELIVKCAPYFKRKTEDVLVNEKRTTKIEAEIHSVPKAVVTWYKDNKQIQNDDRIQINDAKGGVYQLVIKNSKKEDTGTYRCRAVNEIGHIECSSELSIERAPEFLKKLEKLVAAEQCEAEWTFQLIGLPKPTIEISRNDQLIDIASLPDLYSLDELDNKQYCLKFNCVSKSDVGTWRITATNSAGKATTLNKLDSMSLSPPVFIKGLNNTHLPQDIDNKLEVLINALPFPDFVWYKNGQKINLDTYSRKYKTELDKENNLIRLVLIKSQEEDSGHYKVTLFNPGGEASSEGYYTIKGTIPKFAHKPLNVKVFHNTKALFAVSVDGDPMPLITWSKGGCNLSESSKNDIFYDDKNDTHFLEINDCTTKDAGSYKVTASNIYGTDFHSFMLNVTQNKEEITDFIEDIRIKLKSRSARKVTPNDSQCPEWNSLKRVKIKHDNHTQELKHSEPKFKIKQIEEIIGNKFILELNNELRVPEHKSAVFSCSVSDLNAKVAWYFNHQLIDDSMKRFQIYALGELRILTILNCLWNETNSFVKCKWDDIETNSKLFITNCPIIIKNSLRNQKVLKNSNIVLDCEITSTIPVAFKWKKNSEVLNIETNRRKYEFIVEDNIHRLKINNFNENDDGIYEIYVSEPVDFDVSSQAKIEIDLTIVAKRPTIKYDSRLNRDLILTAEQKLNINCEITGVPRPSIKWYKDFTEIYPVNKGSRATVDNSEEYSKLFIDKIKLKESGEYICRAENDIGRTEAKFTVKVLDVPSPPEKSKIEDVTTTTSRLSWLEPTSDGNSPISGYCIEKYDTRRCQFICLGKTSLNEFFVEKLEKGQTHTFRVMAENKVGLSEPCELIKEIPGDIKREIETGDKPRLLEGLKDSHVLLGDVAMFSCRVESRQPIELKWYLNDDIYRPINVTEKIKNNTIEMILKSVQIEDEGKYRLVIKNPFGQVTTEAKLTLLRKPEIKYVTKYDKDMIIFAEQNLNICCETYGNPVPEVKWLRNNTEIKKKQRVQIEDCTGVTRLFIEKIKCDESGEYCLRLSNEVGKAEAKFIVKVLDVPLPPENFVAEDMSSTTSKLTWDPPESDGNSPLIGYYIERFDSRRGTFVRLGKTSLNEFLVEKLEKDQKNQLRIFAENKVGLSEPCDLKEHLADNSTKDIPGPPNQPTITEITKSSCRVSWEEPRNTGGLPITGYYIERKFASRWLRLNYNYPVRDKIMNVNDLIEDKDYEFRICAVNDKGEGSFSRSSEPFTAKNQFMKPNPPGYVDIRGTGKTSCRVTWVPHEKTGNLPIVQYFIEMRKRGDTQFTKFTDDFIAECEYEVTGLNETKEYQFRVIAVNSVDKSEPSDPSRYFKARNQSLPQIKMDKEFGNAVGSNGRIEAYITGTPTPDVRWRKGPRLITNNSLKYSVSFSEPYSLLIIKNLNEEDAGEYTIEADNIEGDVTKSCQFLIHGPPSIEIDQKYKKLTVLSAGDNLRLPCMVKGLPKPIVTWYKNGSLLINKSRNPTDCDHYLELKECTRYNTGSYFIKAKNEYGECQSKFDVLITDTPDKPYGPIDVKLDSKAKTALIEWSAPLLDGGSDIISYTVEYARVDRVSSAQNLVWIKAGLTRSTNYVMENLIRNHYYYFRIFAENFVGLSEPLEMEQPIQSKPNCIYAPDAPEGPIQIKNIKSSECTISWSLPEDDGGDPVQSFIIEIKDSVKNIWIQVNSVDVSKTQLKITKLVEGVWYNFRISAGNKAGFGDCLYSDEPVFITRPASVPDPPAQLIVSDKQTNNCTLEWKPPTWTGGDDLISYLIEMRIGDNKFVQWNKVTNVKANLKAHKVLNLTENIEYHFRISATNKTGSSKPLVLSSSVVLKPKMIPQSPAPKKIQPLKIETPQPAIPQKIVIKPMEKKPIVPIKIKAVEIEKPAFCVPSRPEGPLVVSNVTDTTAAYIQKTISWRKPISDGGSSIIGYLIKRKDTSRPWQKRVSANILSIKIKELVEYSCYVVQVFAENSQGLSSPLESNEPVKARITSLYIVQEVHREEIFFKYTAENTSTTLWATINSSKMWPNRNKISSDLGENKVLRSNKKLKYIQSKLKLN